MSKRVSCSTATRYWWNSDSINTATRRHLLNPEQIDDILQFEDAAAGSDYFPLADALGSVMVVVDSSGIIVRRFGYEVYGARTTTGSGPAPAFGFSGREHDGWGGVYQRDRSREVAVGGWMQVDRAGMVDGPQQYLYARASPSRFIDPTGEVCIGAHCDGLRPRVGCAKRV